MGNSNESSSASKTKLPFSMREDDYNPLGEDDEFSKQFKCSMKTRLIGYGVCCIVGWLFSFLGTLSLVLHHDTTLFAILYSLGQVLNITGSCFLATPQKQAKNMAHPKRIALTAIYLGLILLTLFLGLFLPENLTFLVFLSLIAQIVAYFFYTLSYIPFGRKILKKVCRLMVE